MLIHSWCLASCLLYRTFTPYLVPYPYALVAHRGPGVSRREVGSELLVGRCAYVACAVYNQTGQVEGGFRVTQCYLC